MCKHPIFFYILHLTDFGRLKLLHKFSFKVPMRTFQSDLKKALSLYICLILKHVLTTSGSSVSAATATSEMGATSHSSTAATQPSDLSNSPSTTIGLSLKKFYNTP